MERPPYVIFQDNSLEDMATQYPVTPNQLLNIIGVGEGKAQRYGKDFCELIARYCEQNDIERPDELRVRVVANKSKLKVGIIQRIDSCHCVTSHGQRDWSMRNCWVKSMPS